MEITEKRVGGSDAFLPTFRVNFVKLLFLGLIWIKTNFFRIDYSFVFQNLSQHPPEGFHETNTDNPKSWIFQELQIHSFYFVTCADFDDCSFLESASLIFLAEEVVAE